MDQLSHHRILEELLLKLTNYSNILQTRNYFQKYLFSLVKGVSTHVWVQLVLIRADMYKVVNLVIVHVQRTTKTYSQE